jgi:hypothetical protein
MSDSISVAADAVVTFLAAGGGAVAAGAASEAGAELYKSTTSVAAKIGHRLRGRSVNRETVTAALQGALGDGELTMAEIERLDAATRSSGSTTRISIGQIESDAVFVSDRMNIEKMIFGKSDE